MSRKYGLDGLDKWDKNLKNWEDSDLYYPSEEEDYENEQQENEEDGSTEHKRYKR